jgi:pyridoxal phosphate enzyme (YggS family)
LVVTRAETIAANLERVRERMRTALTASKRDDASVTLLAVSKTVVPDDIVAAIAAGQLDFGENYGQELRDKQIAVARRMPQPPGSAVPRWHFIGPLQGNKVKYVAGKVALLHSVGSLDLLDAIEAKAVSLGVVQDCLVQVNVAGEVQKSGIAPASLPTILDRFAQLGHVRCKGLMVIPPYDENPEASRPHFVALRRLQEAERVKERPNVRLDELSMGMSHDLEVALVEGATIVRVGTAIFGERT